MSLKAARRLEQLLEARENGAGLYRPKLNMKPAPGEVLLSKSPLPSGVEKNDPLREAACLLSIFM